MDTVTAVIGPDVSLVARSHSTLDHVDYVDHFTLQTPLAGAATPEHWARALFGDTPSAGERLIWQGILRLRLERGASPDTIAGWRITERTATWIRLDARSKSLSGQLVVQADEDRVSLTTFVRFDRRVGRIVWSTLSGVHRRLVPQMLRDSAVTIERDLQPTH